MGINHAAYKERVQRCLADTVIIDTKEQKDRSKTAPNAAPGVEFGRYTMVEEQEAPSKVWFYLLAWRQLWLARFLRLVLALKLVEIETTEGMAG